MPNWHYNGCSQWNLLLAVHWTRLSRAQFEFLSDSLSCDDTLLSPLTTPLPFPFPNHTQSVIATGNYAAILPAILSLPFCDLVSSLPFGYMLYEVIVIIIAHTQSRCYWTQTPCTLCSTFCSASLLPATFCLTSVKNKCNLLLPICQKHKNQGIRQNIK